MENMEINVKKYGINALGEVYVFVHELRMEFEAFYGGKRVILTDIPQPIAGEPGAFTCTGRVYDNEDRVLSQWTQLCRATALSSESGNDPFMDSQSLCELHLLKKMLPHMTVTEDISVTVKKILLGKSNAEAETETELPKAEVEKPKRRKRSAAAKEDVPVAEDTKKEPEIAPILVAEPVVVPPAPVKDEGMTIDEAKNIICEYEKCAGKTMAEVQESFPAIFAWLLKASAVAVKKFPKEVEAAKVLASK